MLKLNFALYTGQTLLGNWWKEVKTHFTEVQNAHNALEQELTKSVSAEAEARQSADNVLSGSIDVEKSERKEADGQLRATLDNKAAELDAAVKSEAAERRSGDAQSAAALNTERTERQSADAQIITQLNAETSARQNENSAIKTDIAGLQETSHTHENQSVLMGITADDVAAWRDKTDHSMGNLTMLEYLEEFCRALSHGINELYGSAGVTVYDGGTDGEIQSGAVLDGGDFDSTDFETLDCGTFESNIFAAAAVVDGGQY